MDVKPLKVIHTSIFVLTYSNFTVINSRDYLKQPMLLDLMVPRSKAVDMQQTEDQDIRIVIALEENQRCLLIFSNSVELVALKVKSSFTLF